MKRFPGNARLLTQLAKVQSARTGLPARPFGPAQKIAFFAALKARHWSPKAQLPTATPARRPIFILGMMRSGTTLMERIVASHPLVYGAGEPDYLGKSVMAEMAKGTVNYMAFAETQAPGAICHVDYAELTRTPEPVIRRVLDFGGLPFDPACLAPEKNDRQIQTASYKQARAGIYQGSTGKWRGFEPYLKPLINHFSAG